MAQENNMPIDIPADLHNWLVIEAARRGVTLDDLVADALSHYRASTIKARANTWPRKVVGF